MMGEMIRVSGRAPDVGDILKEAILSQRFTDVTLCCPGGQRFLAHRLVLSAASPYLQEVLLAHSKAAGHCEPITVILAEMEAPELAALLGFVYTGSATVPRMRLDAFLRAAETLRIRLPPVPMIATCGEQATDCKLENTKDVKVCSKYLRCDQYPWYSPGKPPYETILDKKESRTRNSLTDNNIFGDTRILHEFQHPGPSFSPSDSSNTWPRTGFPHHDGRISDPSAEKSYTSLTMLTDRNLAMGPESSSFDMYRRGACLPAEGYNGTDPLERLGTGYERPQVDCPMEKPMNGNVLAASSEEEFCGRMRGDECSYQSGASSLRCAVTGRTRSFEKSPDYSSQAAGEDLSCGESCCRWRTARRHVANSVTASPWRQIIRPHHSPRTPRAVLAPQRHADDEIQKKPPNPELTRSTVISISPRIHSPGTGGPGRNDGLYAFEVPVCETNFNGDAARPPREIGNTIGDGDPDAKIQEAAYRSPAPFAPSNRIAPLTTREASFSSTGGSNASTQLLPCSNNDSVIRIGEYSTTRTTLPRTPTKPELSHPISRLCDTIESDSEKKNTSRTETTEKNGDERIARILVNSDDNNNNETIVGTEGVAQRGRPADDHKCDQCGKTFVTRASLKVHSRTHSGEKPFRCADCGKQFSQLRNYKYHRSVHEGTREFAATCPECGKYFNDRGYLSSHMKIHRNRKEYGCAECGKSFNQRVAYNMHVRIHTGVKPHQCDQCGKAFSRKMLLKQHLRTHSGERPYQCQVCQKAFADRSNMTLHTRLHSGLKPYQCSLCSKAFTKKHHLKTHLNYHTGTKPYSCSNCGGKFSQSSNMRTHFKKCIVNNAAGTAVKSGCDEAGTDRADPEGNASSQMVLTPPNSDQESSILTPISKNVAAIDGNT